MKVRIFSILIAVCLGLIGPVQAAVPMSSSGSGMPNQEIYLDSGLVADLSTFITAEMQAAKVPGLSLALIQAGKISWEEGFGVTNSLTGSQVNADTVFEVASISKVITAYAALALVERGVLSLDEPVTQYLSQPWLPPSDYADQITLRHLLTHTSGLTNHINPVDKSIVSQPGERYEYSGVGFIYLQEVMEQATGKSLEQIAQELVFKPLAIESSSFVAPPQLLPRLAYGHINYGLFVPQLLVVLVIAFASILLVWLIIRRIRLGRFVLSGKMLWISYGFAALSTLGIVFYIAGGVNKWLTLSALWLILLGGVMALLFLLGKKLVSHLAIGQQSPLIQAALYLSWIIFSALALLLLTNALSGPVPRLPAGPPGAAYSLRTTAPDLSKILLELTSPQHLDPALMAEMTSPQVQVKENQSWGLGIGIRHISQGNILWHGGDNADFHALMVIDQEQRNGVVVLTNGQYGEPLVQEIVVYTMDKISAQN
jgi:CubicO group peptidase (beta-lactamase class C family)